MTTSDRGYGSRIALGFASLVRDDEERTRECTLSHEGRGERKKSYTAAVVTPPSTTMVCPVMKLEASEPR
jgi:hypothetical protein